MSPAPARSAGRIVGLLLLTQLLGLILPFVLIHPIVAPDFLEAAAGSATQIKAAVLLFYANGAITIGIAVAVLALVRDYGLAMALWLLAASVSWFALQAVDNAHILSLLSLSQRYTEHAGSSAEALGAVADVARLSRVWVHYSTLLVVEAWFFVFYLLLFRLSLVPRPLAGFALIMPLLHAAAVTLPKFIGYDSMLALAPSLGLSHLVVAGWLIARGFNGQGNNEPQT